MTMDTREILVGARKLLEDPANWIRGDFEDNGGHCLIGACRAVARAHSVTDERLVAHAIHGLREVISYEGRGTSVALFNDSMRTSHADVLSVLDLAIAKAGAQS